MLSWNEVFKHTQRFSISVHRKPNHRQYQQPTGFKSTEFYKAKIVLFFFLAPASEAYLYTAAVHLYANTAHLYAVLAEFFTTAAHLYTAAAHLYASAVQLFTTVVNL